MSSAPGGDSLGEAFEIRVDDAVRDERHSRALEVVERRAASMKIVVELRHREQHLVDVVGDLLGGPAVRVAGRARPRSRKARASMTAPKATE